MNVDALRIWLTLSIGVWIESWPMATPPPAPRLMKEIIAICNRSISRGAYEDPPPRFCTVLYTLVGTILAVQKFHFRPSPCLFVESKARKWNGKTIYQVFPRFIRAVCRSRVPPDAANAYRGYRQFEFVLVRTPKFITSALNLPKGFFCVWLLLNF